MEITGGPPTPTPVDVDMSVFGTTFASGDGGAGLSIGLSNGSSPIVQWRDCSGSPCVFPSVVNATTTVTLMSNTLYNVVMAVGGGVSTINSLGIVGPGTGVAE